MEDFVDRYGNHLFKLKDRISMKEFQFDQVLLAPTAEGYRAIVELAKIEINPKILNHLSKNWSEGTIENLLFFAMAAAVYARSVSNPPYTIDIGKVLLKTQALCNLRCIYRKDTGGGCFAAINRKNHHLPKCIKLPKEIVIIWGCLKRYVATGKVMSLQDAISINKALSIKIDPGSDFSPATSC